MRVEEMALRSEIRQMLAEAGINRETIKGMVKEAIDDVVKNQVNQVLMERKERGLDEVVENYLNQRMQTIICNSAKDAIVEKLRWMEMTVNVDMNTKD